jgi:hypothetical protein
MIQLVLVLGTAWNFDNNVDDGRGILARSECMERHERSVRRALVTVTSFDM